MQEFLKCPASPERTRRGIHFPKGGIGLCNSGSQNPGSKDAANKSSATQLAKLRTGAQASPLSPEEPEPRPHSSHPGSPPASTCWGCAEADVLAGPAAGKSGRPGLLEPLPRGLSDLRAPAATGTLLVPAPQVQAPLSCIAAGGTRSAVCPSLLSRSRPAHLHRPAPGPRASGVVASPPTPSSSRASRWELRKRVCSEVDTCCFWGGPRVTTSAILGARLAPN